MKYLSLLIAVSLCSIAAGCQQTAVPVEETAAPIEQNAPSVATSHTSSAPVAPVIVLRNAPPSGKVLIVPQKVQSNAREVRWKWTIYGDPKWKPNEYAMASHDNGKMGLNTAELGYGTLPAPDPPRKVSIYEYDVTLTVSDKANGLVQLDSEQTLRNIGMQPGSQPNGPLIDDGSINNRTKSGQSALQPFDAGQSVKLLVQGEQNFSLPFDKPMLEITVKTADGTPYKQVFHLKMPK